MLKIEFPPSLKKLKQLDQQLEREGLSLDERFGLILEEEDFRYAATPLDVATFAYCGTDGIHYGLLTDFGKAADLEQAFVVCISPMNFGSEIKIVAKNLLDFMSLLCTVKDAIVISDFTYFQEEEEYRNLLDGLKEEDNEYPEIAEQKASIANAIKAAFNCKEIYDVFHYVEIEVKEERERQTVLSTRDGLGVMAVQEDFEKAAVYEIEENAPNDAEEIESFLNNAPIESRLAFIRDVQSMNLIEERPDIKHLVEKELLKLNLQDELERLRSLE
jgi:hypothetical protein